MTRHPVYNRLDVGLFVRKCEGEENGHQADHLGTPQNYLGALLGAPTPTLGTTGVDQLLSVSGRQPF